MSFLEQNTKTIVHLRKRIHDNLLGLCFGAGIGADFGFPNWQTLVERIADHPAVMGRGLIKSTDNLPSQVQYLFHKFLNDSIKNIGNEHDPEIARRIAITNWVGIVHSCLYKNAIVNDTEMKNHPYLLSLIPLIKSATMTVNYNFDDSIERMIYLFNEEQSAGSDISFDDKGFEVVWQPSTQFRRPHGVIYHPNGFLPLEKTDGTSEHLIFMDQEFSDQLIDVGSGHYACLLNHLSKNTLVFLGLSLNDTTLRHLLRISARTNPGNIHYLIQWCNEENKPTLEQQKTIVDANFSVYNLVTLFYDTDEIKKLASFMVMSEAEFEMRCEEVDNGVNTDYRYYITGPVGAGKSTMLSIIKCFTSFDEWVDRKHVLLAKPQGKLTDDERTNVDKWINNQFRKKNRRISNCKKSVLLIDRSPLDPLYFVKNEQALKERSVELMKYMVPENGNVKQIAPGHLIVLSCDTDMLGSRLAIRGKTYNNNEIDENRKRLLDFWEPYNVSFVNATHLTIAQTAKRILEIILFDTYTQVDFHAICLKEINK